MTSSVLDGPGAGCESPAPPAFSPLTDPAPGNREPSVGLPVSEPTGHDTPQSRPARPPNPISQTDPATPEPQKPQPQHPQNSHSVGDAMHIDVPLTAGMDYTTQAGLEYFSQTNPLLMALARLSAANPSPLVAAPPSTVRPDQVSLPPHAMLDPADGLMPAAADTVMHAPPAAAPLESFARVEFADSVFQMTTYAVIIGRDQRALDQARRDERRLDDYQRRVRENEEMGLPAPSPPTQDRGKFSKSYVSEEGGMLGPESDGDDNPRPSKRRKTSGGAGSASGESHQVEAAAGDLAGLEDKNTNLNRQYVSHTPGAAAVDLSALRPSPYYVPFIGIHSPGPNIASRTKAISREHLKIQFNQTEGVFEAIPLHKNGFFCEDVHYKDQKVVLRSGDRLQIKDVDFVFVVNGVPRGKTGAEDGLDEDGVSSRRYSEGGKEMSFDFESSHDQERRSTSPEEVPAVAAKEDSDDSELSEPGDEDMADAEGEHEETPEQDVMETIENDQDPDAPTPIKPEMSLELLAGLEPIIPKKRGPGRPPKNGIMSKREERLRKKAAMELAKKNMPQPPPGEPPIKRKVGRPRKHPLPENAPDRPEKRKYKPRKSKNGEEGEISDVEKTIKERRREKPKTPPLELNRDDYTEEQLQKPPKNYGMLIDEVLTAAPDGLTLKQIYKRIQMKYPFYYFTVDTKGWESSVRHNLIGNDAFKKNEETHLWSRVPGIDIDAGKKRTKAASPDHTTSMHTFGQHYSTSATPTPQMFHAETGPQQGYRPGSVQRTAYPTGHNPAAIGQHPQPHLGAQAVGAAAQQVPRQTYPAPAQPQGATPTAGYGEPAAARPAQANAQATAYSSPYTSRPPPATAAQPGVPQTAARQGLPPHHVPSPANGLPRVPVSPAQAAGPARPAPAVNGNALVLKPAVPPELVRHVTNFKTTVTEQLAKRTPAAEAVAMSVINRGLGLAAESTVPDEEGLEKIVLGVFESSRKKLGADQSLHPGLVQALGNFKNNMIKTLEPKMGKLNAERLILSAVDRVLGFAERSTMPGADAEKKQYDDAENVLITAIQRVVAEHQRTLAAVASASTSQPASRPGLPPSAPAAAPSQAPKGQAPASGLPAGAYATTAPISGTKPAQPAYSPVPTGAAPTAKPITTTAPAQQVPRPAPVPAQAQPAAAPIAQPRPQASPSGPIQGSAQAQGQYLGATTATAGAQVAAAARNPVPTGAVQPPAQSSAQAIPPQSPAHALAQAQAQAAAQSASIHKPAQPPAVVSAPAPVAASGQPLPATTAAPAAAQPPAAAAAPTPSQHGQQAPLPKPQHPPAQPTQPQTAPTAPPQKPVQAFQATAPPSQERKPLPPPPPPTTTAAPATAAQKPPSASPPQTQSTHTPTPAPTPPSAAPMAGMAGAAAPAAPPTPAPATATVAR